MMIIVPNYSVPKYIMATITALRSLEYKLESVRVEICKATGGL